MNNINQIHKGTGDNVAGDKIGSNFVNKKNERSIPVWAQWIAWVVAILALVFPFFT